MPITTGVPVNVLPQKEFHALDYEVMELVFAVHNDIGRFHDEKIYQAELAYRCESMGFDSVLREVSMRVSYKDFQKVYYLDLLVNNALVYEMKAVDALGGAHQTQLLNYLFLMGVQHGKLINMRPTSVEYKFVSTTLTLPDRYAFDFMDLGWSSSDVGSWLRDLIVEMIKEWGVFLELELFYDAVKHFRGEKHELIRDVDVIIGGRR